MNSPCFLSLLLLLTFLLPAVAKEKPEGVREQWGEFFLVLKEPVVSRTVVENSRRLSSIEAYEQSRRNIGASIEPALERPSAEECGLKLFTVQGNPAPTLRWVDQNKLRINFAPGSSPSDEFRVVFTPGTTYLSGAALAAPSFSFRCKPARFSATWLPEHWGGAALLTSIQHNTREAQALVEQHENIRVSFRRMRHVPLAGWVCTSTVPATLRPATLADGFGRYDSVLSALLRQMKPEDIREETPLPQCLVAVPKHPLVPGVRYELGVEVAEGSGFIGGNLDLGELPHQLVAELERTLMHEEGKAPYTRLMLRFNHPIPEGQLRALWGRMRVSINGVPAPQQPDACYRAGVTAPGSTEAAPATLQLRGFIPCASQARHYLSEKTYNYTPKGCAQGLEMELRSEHPLELKLTLPADVQTRHGLALMKEQSLSASISPAAPALTGNGCNLLPFTGQHVLQLPLINLGELRATAYHWDAAHAARLLPAIQHAMRDDTLTCELSRRLAWVQRRAKEGLTTEGWAGDDARSEAERALKLLLAERKACEALRAQVLAAASAYEPQPLELKGTDQGNGLLQEGWAALDLDKLTGGQLRPGLYLISLSCRPTADVVQALAAYGMKEEQTAEGCTVDVLVQVTDMSLRRGGDRLLVNSLVTGQPLEEAQVSFYTLPEDDKRENESARVNAAAAEASPAEGMAALAVQQGEAVLPEQASGKLLLVQRGEDYVLFSLWRDEVRSLAPASATAPMLELFCDRPLYRPGDVAHLRAVLRRPVAGGLALPRALRGTLVIHKPNGEVLETRSVALDAYGALTADVTLPKGEEDVAGIYRCELEVEESGKLVEAALELPCEVFRRDAFKASLSIEAEPVDPQEYRVLVQATDYNGTPLAGGKVELELSSTAPLRDEGGRRPEGLKVHAGNRMSPTLYGLQRSLVLDGEGRASISGHFGAYTTEIILNASASISNDREDYLSLPRQWQLISPADFGISVNGEQQLHLRDARQTEFTPLAREQQVELRVVVNEEQRCELPSGVWYTEMKERELLRRSITVPANCKEGIALRPLWEKTEWYQERRKEGPPALRLILSGRDEQGRLIEKEERISPWPRRVEEAPTTLKAEGRSVRMELNKNFRESGMRHAYISSQGQRRHVLVSVSAGAKELSIPLAPQEYGDVAVTLLSCEKDDWGNYTNWTSCEAACELPRPDKQLTLEFRLPAGAKPGDKVTLSGRVLGADGKARRAAVTLFAVDAGMMSVAPYRLPELATLFYRGAAPGFSLASGGRVGKSCKPRLLVLPNVWDAQSGSWRESPPPVLQRSVLPAGMNVGSFSIRELGGLFRFSLHDVVLASRPNFRWSNVLGFAVQEQEDIASAPAAAPMCVVSEEAPPAGSYGVNKSRSSRMTGGLRSGSGVIVGEEEEGLSEAELGEAGGRAYALAETDALWDEGALIEPRLRQNFAPVALWLASLESGKDGSFSTECTLPDTLTTYKVYAVALGADGDSFGQAEGEFMVNQDLMLTAGTPFFMSSGDKLQLPLTVTNNRDSAGEWTVRLEGAGEVEPQQIRLEGRQTTTLSFEVQAGEEGECTLRWTARSADSADAVEGSFPVRYPAPLLKEAHRLVLAEEGSALASATLLAPELAEATRGEIEVQYSSSPLIHLAGNLDFLLNYPYGCTEQRASALLPWLFHEQLAPFCPQMAESSVADAKAIVARSITQILARQQEDGGLSYWSVPKGERGHSSTWSSAYAGLVLTLAKERGFAVPEAALQKLRDYLGRHNWYKSGYLTQYAVARTRGRNGEVNRILVKALRQELKMADASGWERNTADLEFMAALRSSPKERHAHLLSWLRSKGKDYRHRSSWSSGWTLIALAEYLKLEPTAAGKGSLRINGNVQETDNAPGSLRLMPEPGQSLSSIAPTLSAEQGTCYVSLRVKAQPERRDYPGITEHGLQVTRVYEVQDAEGKWQQTRAFRVGDVVRVTLTCAKIADKLEYFVLEDYLPACMEAINPNVPSQAVGLEDGGWGSWSACFDHKEYLADRVRGFCTRWAGRELVNMSYYARVKRAGESTAPPAAAQLMYEPQVYGLSENAHVVSVPAQAR